MRGDEKLGVDIVYRALSAPIKQIAENCGLEGSLVAQKVEDADEYAKLMKKQEEKDGHEYFLFEQSKHYGNGKA